MKKINALVDTAFCVVLLPVLIIAFPVERWWATAPLYFGLFVVWLYATYFLFRYYVVPRLFLPRRRLTAAVACIALSLTITAGFSAYKITSPYYHLRQQHATTERVDIPVWGIRPNRQAVWLHYIIVVMFSFAVGMYSRGRSRQMVQPPVDELQHKSSQPTPQQSLHAQPQIVLKCDYRNVPLNVDDIEYIQAIGNYVKFHLADGSHLMSKATLSGTLASLPHDRFVRIHRSYVVANGRISGFSGTRVFIGDKELPIGKTYAQAVMAILSEQP
ncbi:MAG: LytR/AlgR family response regulator transcription factor [Muribaculaceae bacterium]